MKGGGLGRPPPDAGIPHDMKTLLNAFKERNSLRLIEFYEVAVNYGLKDIYAGRMSVADLVGFAECLLNAAFAYTRPCKEYPNGLGEEQTITERIFGIYVTFVLFYAQPIDYVTKIRILPEDCVSIVHFAHEILLPGGHLDAYACLQRLFCDGAFRIVMSIKDYDLSNHHRYEKPNPVELLVDEDERYAPLEAASSIMKHPLLKAMNFVERKVEQKEIILFNRRITERENDKFNFLDRLQTIYATLAHEFYKTDNEIEEDIFEKWKCSSSAIARKKQPESSTAQKPQSVKAVGNGAARGKRKLES
ncbi:hypothetical protein V3C99_002850 [Haemonchus contortus]|uniref:Uncharacterized protein n=1 Tax=Haemonchus contortus TaxID=6289 RepID=A0A7I4Y903_HAECO|nr:Small nuclear RNA activating complex (SNAPc) domain containing protein [Haemonchus contortus]